MCGIFYGREPDAADLEAHIQNVAVTSNQLEVEQGMKVGVFGICMVDGLSVI